MLDLQTLICSNIKSLAFCLHLIWLSFLTLFLWAEKNFGIAKKTAFCVSLLFLSFYALSGSVFSLKIWNQIIFCFSLAIVAVFDATEFMIPRICTLGLIPAWFLNSYFGFLQINLCQSVLAMGVGYSSFFFLNKLFYLKNGENGLGVGDMELAAMIGSFFGTMDLIYSINVSTILALICSVVFALVSGKGLRTFKIPYGFFLALGSVCFFLFQHFVSF